MNIAEHVIEKCGGATVVSKWLSIPYVNVRKWTYPKEKGGRGGLVPAEYQKPLLDAAKAAGVELTHQDFFEVPAPQQAAE